MDSCYLPLYVFLNLKSYVVSEPIKEFATVVAKSMDRWIRIDGSAFNKARWKPCTVRDWARLSTDSKKFENSSFQMMHHNLEHHTASKA